MVEFKDYYKTLGVARGASAKEIKAAYRRLARKHHPDVNPGNAAAEARFKEVNEAHDVLSDPDKRRRYDELGANWDTFRQAPPPGGGRPGARSRRVEFGDEVGGFSDFFRTFFSGAGGGGGFGGAVGGAGLEDLFERGRAAPAAEEAPVELTLEELLNGTTRTLELERGATPRRVDVKIPPGVHEGSRVRVPARAVGPGRGDVFLRVHVRQHARFERRDDDLHVTMKVPLTTAVLGGEVQVPTLDGSLNIKVPAATPNGRTFRLRGQGLPKGQGGERGDLLAELSVELPKSVGARERELFEELRDLGY